MWLKRNMGGDVQGGGDLRDMKPAENRRAWPWCFKRRPGVAITRVRYVWDRATRPSQSLNRSGTAEWTAAWNGGA